MKFAIVCEAPADREIAQVLADRVVLEIVDWADGNLHALREWCDSVTADAQNWILEWTTIKHLAKALKIRIHGHFDGEPGAPDAATARRAVLVLQKTIAPVAVFLIRDADNHQDRRIGLEQARQHFADHPLRVVIGLANAEREAWVLAGFVANDEREQELVAAERQNLGFDPCERSAELTAGRDDTAKRSPKRVLNVLTNGSRDREQECWNQTSLEILRKRGEANGLNEYLNEVQTHVVPLFTGREQPKS
jgi:hypothetical protein